MSVIRSTYLKLKSLPYYLGVGAYSSLLKKNKQILGKKESNRCYILATGPSINKMDLAGLENEFCISVSNFFVHPLFKRIKPRFHIFAGTHPPLTNQQVGDWWQDATNHLNGNDKTGILINARDKKIEEEFKVFTGHKVYYYLEGGNYPIDFCKQLPEIKTVVHIAIYLAIYLEMKEIVLLGCDHSWLLHFGQSQHFYQESEHALVRNNHNEWSVASDIGDEFRSYADLWDIYRKIKNESKKKGVTIYNATPGSLLDIFPRKDLNELLNVTRN
jgi:hypothetical protein